MADGLVQVSPDSSGKKIDTSEITVGLNTVERQRINIADPTNATSIAAVKAASTAAVAADPALVVVVSPNNVIPVKSFDGIAVPRTTLCIFCDDITGVASETVLSCSINKAGVVTTAQSSYTVTVGKTLRITAFTAYIKGTTTTAAGAKIRIRQAASAVGATSPIVATLGVGMPAAVATASNGNAIEFENGIEIPSGQQVCLSQLATSTACAVSGCLTGFEY